MSKLGLAMVTVSLGFMGAAIVSPKPVDAATWHNGMPKVLRGTWHTKKVKAFGNVSFKLKATKNASYAFGLDPDFLKRTKYQYLGHHSYKIWGIEPIYSKKPGIRYYKWLSKHHILYGWRLKKSYTTSYYR